MSKYTIVNPPKKVVDWKGMHILSKQDMTNGLGKIPSGTILIITHAGVSKSLETLPCKCCGIAMKITTKKTAQEFKENFDFIDYKEEKSA